MERPKHFRWLLQLDFLSVQVRNSQGNGYVWNRSRKDGVVLGAKYDDETGLIVGEANDSEALFKAPVQVPDYSRAYSVAWESSEALYASNPLNPKSSYLMARGGNYCSQYSVDYFSDHTGISTGYTPQSSFVPPEDGYIIAHASHYPAPFPSGCNADSFVVTVNAVTVFNMMTHTTTPYRLQFSDVIPVRRGDDIRYGRAYRDGFCLAPTYSITFAPLAP